MTSNVYTPVLRWKPAEQGALAQLSRKQREGIKPLIEVMPPRTKKKPVRFSTAVARSIVGAWGPRREFFVDFSRVMSTVQVREIVDAISALEESGAMPTIVIPMQRNSFVGELSQWLAQHSHRLSIRIDNAALVSTTLQRDIAAIIAGVKRNSDDVDVLLDFGSMTDGTSMQRTAELVAKMARWSSATIVGGSFPPDLAGLAKNDQHLLPRSEWLAWESLDRRAIQSPCRFGDYTVVTADFSEPPPRANFSASIRYTTQRDFVVMRGEGVFNDEGAGFDQYPAQARMLSLRGEYCGAQFSAGDRYILEMGGQTAKTGTAETWLRAGINHHIVFVGRQLAA